MKLETPVAQALHVSLITGLLSAASAAGPKNPNTKHEETKPYSCGLETEITARLSETDVE
jgi:hypothetical protein